MTIIFRMKTKEAHRIKVLAELLSSNIKTGCFVIDERGMSLTMMDQNKTILLDMILIAENFSVYKLTTKKIHLGINLNFFQKMLKSVKKKDSLEFFIDDKAPNDLAIQVIPKENNRVSTSYLKIQNVQNLEIDIPTGYSKPIIVSSGEYQKIIKDMCNIGTIVKVNAKNQSIEFNCNAGGILKRNVKFGEEDTDDIPEKDRIEYNQEFLTEQLVRITKLSGLSTNMKIYPGKPLLFRSEIGTIGTISIYIKSKEQIESENYNTVIESDYESD